MKTFKTIILVLVLCVMNQFTYSQKSTFCNCSGSRIAVYKFAGCYPGAKHPILHCTWQCQCWQSLCVNQGEVASYLNGGWSLCSSFPFPYKIGDDGTTGETELISIYPNPISNSTNISFSLSQTQKVSLKIFDVNGRLVSDLADNIFVAGEYEIAWNVEGINAGIYFLQFQSTELMQTEKMIVSK